MKDRLTRRGSVNILPLDGIPEAGTAGAVAPPFRLQYQASHAGAGAGQSGRGDDDDDDDVQ